MDERCRTSFRGDRHQNLSESCEIMFAAVLEISQHHICVCVKRHQQENTWSYDLQGVWSKICFFLATSNDSMDFKIYSTIISDV